MVGLTAWRLRAVKVVDPRFGAVYMTTDPVTGVTEVSGPGVPTVTVTVRRQEVPAARGVPAARDVDLGRAEVRLDGRVVAVRQEPGGRLRRGARVRVEYGGAVLRVRPTGRRRSVLLRERGLPGMPARRVGAFTRRRAAGRRGAGARGVRGGAPYETRWGRGARPTAAEAALGHALVAVLGVGGEGRTPWEEGVDVAVEGGGVLVEGGAVVARGVGAVLRGLFN